MAVTAGYLKHLPGIFRSGDSGFLDSYLKVFEALLSGRGDVPAAEGVRSLESLIEDFPARLDPALAPVDRPVAAQQLRSEFLDYLGRWVALSFDQNWEMDKRRQWLSRIVPLYKRRGTRAGLGEYLSMFVGDQAKVEEPSGGFIVGAKANATVGVSSFIAGAPAHFFRVRINYGFAPSPFRIGEWKNLRKGTKAIVDLEKPAHTYYSLQARTPGIIVGGAAYGGSNSPNPLSRGRGRATIGTDTLIWQESRQI